MHIGMGADINGYPDGGTGFHSHATALHQAVSSGSLDAIKVLVEAGSNAGVKDRIYNGTPLDWAKHMQEREQEDTMKRRFATIIDYLGSRNDS